MKEDNNSLLGPWRRTELVAEVKNAIAQRNVANLASAFKKLKGNLTDRAYGNILRQAISTDNVDIFNAVRPPSLNYMMLTETACDHAGFHTAKREPLLSVALDHKAAKISLILASEPTVDVNASGFISTQTCGTDQEAGDACGRLPAPLSIAQNNGMKEIADVIVYRNSTKYDRTPGANKIA